jgi:CubicO group peptidase (beta-lactamase class C family)
VPGVVVLLFGTAACAPAVISAHRPAGTTGACSDPAVGDFERAAPEEVDLDPEAVRTAIDTATVELSSSVRVYRHDCLVGVSSKDADLQYQPANLWSATKGVVSILVGRAIRLGRLGLDDPIGRYLPEADAAHGAITIRQLLTQSSGLEMSWLPEILPGIDEVSYALKLPFAHPPGTYFEYGQTTVTLLGAVVERAVGEDLQAFAAHQLFDPLGIPPGRWSWARDAGGHTMGYAYLSMAPVDLARLGALLLHRGRWGDQQLLDAGYVDEMGAASPTNGGYGFLTWTNAGDHYFTPSSIVRLERDHPWLESAPRDTYALSGLGDQDVFVVPSLDMVVIRTGFLGPDSLTHDLFRTLMGGVRDVSVPDPGPYHDEPMFDWSDWSKVFDPQLLPW